MHGNLWVSCKGLGNVCFSPPPVKQIEWQLDVVGLRVLKQLKHLFRPGGAGVWGCGRGLRVV
jgi:hypothetical protein